LFLFFKKRERERERERERKKERKRKKRQETREQEKTQDISAFVKKKLMVDMPLLDATLRLRKMVMSAPANYKTRLKNFVHGANQTLKTALSER